MSPIPPLVRVLHFVDSLAFGGTEGTIVKIVAGTAAHFAHTVCAVREFGPLVARLTPLDVAIHCLNKKPGNDWSIALRMARICRVVRPHVVHTCNWSAIDGVLAARLARVPAVVHSEHGWALDRSGLTAGRRRPVRRFLARLSDRVVAVSDDLRHWLTTQVGLSPSKVAVIHGGVDIEQFQPRADRPRREDGGDDFVVGVVARLDPIKNHIGLFEALRVLSIRHPNFRVVLVGDGSERETLERAAVVRQLNGRVQFLGERDDIPSILAACDLFVLPSRFEGISNAILEAMAMGLPVVAARVGGNPEVVVDGVTGLLTAPNDVAAMARAIEFYAEHDAVRRQHGAAGRARVVGGYSVDQMLASYNRLYHDVLERRGKMRFPPAG